VKRNSRPAKRTAPIGKIVITFADDSTETLKVPVHMIAVLSSVVRAIFPISLVTAQGADPDSEPVEAIANCRTMIKRFGGSYRLGASVCTVCGHGTAGERGTE
jgi:hypothetical protein